jgi:hypothetical protein
MVMRHYGHTWRFIDEFLTQIGANRCETSHEWSKLFLCDGLQEFFNEERGGKHHEWFYDVLTELEIEGKVFAMTHCSGKDLSFKVSDLTKFIDRRFYELRRTNR